MQGGSTSCPGGTGPGAGGDREGGAKRSSRPQQPSREQRNAFRKQLKLAQFYLRLCLTAYTSR